MTSSSQYSLRLNEMFKKDILFSFPTNSERIQYSENKHDYLWSTPMLKMALELQCCCVALIVMTQVWILVYFGSEIFEKLIGDELSLPILYLVAIITGTLAYAKPSYWRISLCLTAYCVCIYFSMMVTNVAIKVLMTPELAGILQRQPAYSSSPALRVWIPWAVGFALHMQFCITSFFISIICVRDMYVFNPIVFSTQELDSIGGGVAITRQQSCIAIQPEPTVGVSAVMAADGNNNGRNCESTPPQSAKNSSDMVSYV